ncbi:hypothetical protein TNCV_1574111 [Trichonephila clavipes]|nr:hypothetical protein TNCV_1574111 [Trichonephila clavipes]
MSVIGGSSEVSKCNVDIQSINISSSGWRTWFVTVLVHLRLRVRMRPKSVWFHDAEHRQRPCRMIIGHVNVP